MGAAPTVNELFDPEFLASVERLRLVAYRVASGGRPAEQRSRDLGSGIEFRDFRAYSPGDDMRAIDWNIYRRLGRVFLRLFEELEDLPVYLLPDCSASAFHEEPARVVAGLRTSLALASIALGQHDRVGLFPFGADLEIALRPTSGHGRLLRFAEAMSRLGPMGSTDVAQACRRFASLGLRSGLVVIVSDFFDPHGLEGLSHAFARLRHKLLLVQLHRPGDADPDVSGDVELVDCETGETENISMTPAVRDAYRASYRRFNDGLAELARTRRAGLLRIDVDQEVTPQLATLFETGHYKA